jgi:hypothetical protein
MSLSWTRCDSGGRDALLVVTSDGSLVLLGAGEGGGLRFLGVSRTIGGGLGRGVTVWGVGWRVFLAASGTVWEVKPTLASPKP